MLLLQIQWQNPVSMTKVGCGGCLCIGRGERQAVVVVEVAGELEHLVVAQRLGRGVQPRERLEDGLLDVLRAPPLSLRMART